MTLKQHLVKETGALEIITHGIACNCLITLSKTPLWDFFVRNEEIDVESVKKCSPYPTIYSCMITLIEAGILYREAEVYKLTPVGQSLILDYQGLNQMLFDGYSKLIETQEAIKAENNVSTVQLQRHLKGKEIADASIIFGEKTIDPIILEELKRTNFNGTICDLGAGLCEKLIKICKEIDVPGLGIDSNHDVIQSANQKIQRSQVNNLYAEQGDITSLEGVWEDVVILMQCFVFHDFNPNELAVKILNSYVKNFPNLKLFFYVDIVSPSESHPNLMPGFDYVHGLMKIKPRTYEETIQMFNQSKFNVAKEISIDSLPNTYLWILSL